MKAKSILVLVIALISITNLQAEVITIFDSNAVISTGDAYDTVVVKGDGTVVDMDAGDVNRVIVMNDSTFNFSGGNIGITSSKPLRSYDSSVLNLSGGNIHSIISYGENVFNISGIVSINDDCYFYGSTIVTMASHNVTTPWLYFKDNSQFNLLAGTVSAIMARNNSTINIYGGNITSTIQGHNETEGICKINISDGTMSSVNASTGSLATISGGMFSNISVYDPSSSNMINIQQIRIVGHDLNAVPYGGASGKGQLSGYWNNDIYFSTNLSGYSTYSHLILYDGISPPSYTLRSDLNADDKVNFLDLSIMASEWAKDTNE